MRRLILLLALPLTLGCAWSGTPYEGRGAMTTPPVRLDGTARLTWTVGVTGPCLLTLSLRSTTDGTRVRTLVDAAVEQGQTGESWAYGLPAGSYAVENGGFSCDHWTVAIGPA